MNVIYFFFLYVFFVSWHVNLHGLFNIKAILIEEQQSDKGFHTFPKGAVYGRHCVTGFRIHVQLRYCPASTQRRLHLFLKMTSDFSFNIIYIYIYIYIYVCVCVCVCVCECMPWCNSYHNRKWTRWHKIKYWMRLFCISHSTNTLGKSMNPAILPPAMSK